MFQIGIIGASGLVGQAIISSLVKILTDDKTDDKIKKNIIFHFYGTNEGKIKFGNSEQNIYKFSYDQLLNLDYVILATDNLTSRLIVKYCMLNDIEITIIDNSSVFRMEKNVPLIIPEINIDLLENDEFTNNKTKIISNPNCVTTIVCMCLKPLLDLAIIDQITISTYQAASGAGYKGLDELEKQIKQYVNSEPIEKNFWKIQYVNNVFSHNSTIDEFNGFNDEELKLINESKKILQLGNNCNINPTCIRVPTIRSHCASVLVKFSKSLDKNEIINKLNNFEGLTVMDGLNPLDIPNPVFTSGKTNIFVGRIRSDLNDKSIWNFWISGDQLLKGAGYNSVQILYYLLNKNMNH